MKKLFLLLTLASPLVGLAQPATPPTPPKLADGTPLPYDADTHLLTYQGVVEVAGATQAQLYVRARDWAAKTSSTNNASQPEGTTTDQVVTKGTWPVTISMLGMTYPAGFVQYTLSIYVKEGRYKYVLTNLTHGSTGQGDGPAAAGPLEQANAQLIPMGGKRLWEGVRKQAHADAQQLVTDLQRAMRGSKDPKDF